jgi:hypothetical protein
MKGLLFLLIALALISGLHAQDFIPLPSQKVHFRNGISLRNETFSSAKTSEEQFISDSTYIYQALNCELQQGDFPLFMSVGFGQKGYATGTQGSVKLSNGTNVTISELALLFDFRRFKTNELYLQSIQLPFNAQNPDQKIYIARQVNDLDTFYLNLYEGSRGRAPGSRPFYTHPFTLEDITLNNDLLTLPNEVAIPSRIYVSFTVNRVGGDDTLAFFTSNPVRKCSNASLATYARLVNADNYQTIQWQPFTSLYSGEGYDADIILIPNLRAVIYPESRDRVNTNIYDVSISPNPVTDQLQIKFIMRQPVQTLVTVSDMNGKMIQSFTHHPTNDSEQNLSISVSELPNGIYNVNLFTEGNQSSVRFIINK